MSASLFSPLWYRFAQQCPQLRSHVTVQQQQYRDQQWYLLINGTTGNHYRINWTAYQFVGRCDGQKTIQKIWDSVLETLGDGAPTQDEVIRLLFELDQRDLLRYEVLPDIPGMFRRKHEKTAKQHRAFINPFAFRLPLADPTPLLDRLAWLRHLIFHPVTFALWLLAVASALLVAAAHWHELSTHASSHMQTPHYLFLAWLSFPLIKALHELSHALAVRHWGGEVHEMGVTLFALTPAPYVDASAASGFRRRYQRIIVDAMGIMVELLLGAIALVIWFGTQPGLMHDLAFVALFICGFSTLLFNGNPLLRFDAYYLVCDAFDLPNLATRSRMYWGSLARRLVQDARNNAPFSLAAGERKWLIAYAPLSIAYGIFIAASIVLWLGSLSTAIGVTGALFVLVTMVIKPLWATTRSVLAAAGHHRRRATLAMVSVLAAAMVLLMVVPVPFHTTAQGVIWVPDRARLRPETDGFIKQLRARHGEAVEQGQVLVVLEDPDLLGERETLNHQLTGLRTDQYSVLMQDAVLAASLGEQILKVSAELQRVEERIASLQVRSQSKGVLVMPHQDDLPGTFVHKGAVLGYVLNRDAIHIRVAVPEPDAALLHEHLSGIEARTAEHPDETITAHLVMDTPASTRTLPSAALGDRGGGNFITDAADKDGLISVDPLVLIDLKLPSTILERVGSRASVRFEHGTEPIAMQAYRRLRQTFLRYFNPTT